jgi:hypothetical protein
MQKERYIPSGYELIAKDERYGFEVYGTTSPRIVAICYGGKRTKSDWHYRFKDMASLDKQIAESLSGYMEWQERKEKRKAERSKPHNVKIGDVFRCSWGYDQTNIDYYEVTKVIGAMVEVCEIAQMSEETGFMSGDCVPKTGHFIGKPMRKKVAMWNDSPSIKIYSFASAYRIEPVAMIADKPVFAASEWTAYA